MPKRKTTSAASATAAKTSQPPEKTEYGLAFLVLAAIISVLLALGDIVQPLTLGICWVIASLIATLIFGSAKIFIWAHRMREVKNSVRIEEVLTHVCGALGLAGPGHLNQLPDLLARLKSFKGVQAPPPTAVPTSGELLLQVSKMHGVKTPVATEDDAIRALLDLDERARQFDTLPGGKSAWDVLTEIGRSVGGDEEAKFSRPSQVVGRVNTLLGKLKRLQEASGQHEKRQETAKTALKTAQDQLTEIRVELLSAQRLANAWRGAAVHAFGCNTAQVTELLATDLLGERFKIPADLDVEPQTPDDPRFGATLELVRAIAVALRDTALDEMEKARTTGSELERVTAGKVAVLQGHAQAVELLQRELEVTKHGRNRWFIECARVTAGLLSIGQRVDSVGTRLSGDGVAPKFNALPKFVNLLNESRPPENDDVLEQVCNGLLERTRWLIEQVEDARIQLSVKEGEVGAARLECAEQVAAQVAATAEVQRKLEGAEQSVVELLMYIDQMGRFVDQTSGVALGTLAAALETLQLGDVRLKTEEGQQFLLVPILDFIGEQRNAVAVPTDFGDEWDAKIATACNRINALVEQVVYLATDLGPALFNPNPAREPIARKGFVAARTKIAASVPKASKKIVLELYGLPNHAATALG